MIGISEKGNYFYLFLLFYSGGFHSCLSFLRNPAIFAEKCSTGMTGFHWILVGICEGQ